MPAGGIDLSARDLQVRPGDDFWRHANGAWAARTEIPADREVVGTSAQLSADVEAHLRELLETAAAHPEGASASMRKAGDLYASWMDDTAIGARGLKPLQPYLARIAAAHSKAALQLLFAAPEYASPIAVEVMPSYEHPDTQVIGIGQGELGMARDQYLLDGPQYAATRKAYRGHVQQMLELAGVALAGPKADAIVALETAIAKVQWSGTQSRDEARMNDPKTLAALQAAVPQFHWAQLLAAYGFKPPRSVVLGHNTAVAAIGRLYADTPLQTWQDWLVFRFVNDNADYLPKAFGEAHFDFHMKTLYGVQQQRPRWVRGVQLVNAVMGETLGQAYTARWFPPAAVAQVTEMVDNLRAAYGTLIRQSGWMDKATQQKALAKLAAFEARIGAPAEPPNDAGLQVDRSNLLASMMGHAGLARRQVVAQLDRPVDKRRWLMLPQTVNAYYDPSSNQITFLAAMLQPPAFDAAADPAVNYGAIGTLIGHEMGHAYDDQGSGHGPTGKLENWWTAAAKTAYQARTTALRQQYEGYEVLPGLKLNAAFTLGENIGDLSGMEAAYLAYQRYQQQHGPAPVLDGLTGDQRFFLSHARFRRSKIREGTLRQLTLIDTHAPPAIRLNAIVRNMDAWYRAFDVQPSDALYLPPEARVHLW
ncbi:MAG TPA: M13 family metallopeptidase [Ideonella sp.]|uniref:M13 family metallopeptidase n=1 Tax=Ideonella sp. TaxID=1929293 RepID=UPI002D1030CF|nr:M13 family metallopeptidase [Ideonella sp.]HSI49486.1 M13 family metallopeptidase [Ideonella sp.]